jgi:hypothetical protein
MRIRVFAIRSLFVALLLLAGCAKVTQENFNRIQDGMSEQEVLAILGQPRESSNITVLGLSGTSSKWTAEGAVISVQFVNGKVRAKSFDKQPAK